MSDIQGTTGTSPTDVRASWWVIAALIGVSVVVILIGGWLALFAVGVGLATGGWVASRRAVDPQQRAIARAVLYAGAVMAVTSLVALVALYPAADLTPGLESVHDRL